MGRRIVVTSNCQLGGLHASLSAMLPDDDVVAVNDLAATSPETRAAVADCDVWVTSTPKETIDEISAALPRAPHVVRVPLILFTGFHPDIVHLIGPDGSEIPSAAGAYSSALVVWGWQNGLTSDEILRRFRPSVMAALGYRDAWAGAIHLARHVFEQFEADFEAWYLPLVGQGSFMLTDNHPRLNAIVQMARTVAGPLGADPDLIAYPWEQVIPDGLLATSTVWPIYPGIADSLDLPGAYVWRCEHGELIDLPTFVDRSLALYAAHDPATTVVARFDHDDRWDRVLARDPAEAQTSRPRP